MPPRIPFFGALAQPMRALQCQFSTSAARQVVHRDGPKTATSQLLDLGTSSEDLSRDSTKGASDLYAAMTRRPGGGSGNRASRQELEEDLRRNNQREDYLRQMTRRWKTGDVYAPRDLGPSEMAKLRRTKARRLDLVDILGVRPLDMYRNYSFIAEAITPHGRIKDASVTSLRPVNQRKLAKAVRRAIGLGLHPSVHRHPEMMLRDLQRRKAQNEVTRSTFV